MAKNSKLAEARLKEVLLAEKSKAPFNFLDVLRNDLMYVFDSYVDLEESSFEISVEVAEDGGYKFAVNTIATAVKPFRKII